MSQSMALVSFSPPSPHRSNVSSLPPPSPPSTAAFITIPHGTNSNSSSSSITTAFDYNALIQTHTNSSLHTAAVALFLQMLHSNIPPNHYTFPFLLKSVSALGSVRLAHQIHTHILKFGCFPDNIYSSTAVLDLYAKWGALGDAHKLFDRIPDRNIAVWNSMITCYVQHGLLDEALDMFTAMEVDVGEEVGVSSWNSVIAGCVRCDDVDSALDVVRIMIARDMKPSPATFNTLLPVIPDMGHRIKELHGYVTRHLDVIDISSVDEDRLRCAIATSYAKIRYMDHASRLFQSTTVRSNQLYVAIMSGFLITRNTSAAFEILREAAARSTRDRRVLSKILLTVILPRCDDESGRFKHGLEIHAYAYRHHLESHTSVSNALIAMYAKKHGRGGAAAAKAERVFEMTVDRDVITWNTIVSTNVFHGDFDRALLLFRLMISEGVRPDAYSFGSVLNACGHSSSLLQGMSLHCWIIKIGLSSSDSCCPAVHNAVVDMYGKSGSTGDARKAFDEIEEKDIISWNTVISTYAFDARPHEAFSLFAQMENQGWTPDRVTFTGILSACSHSGLVNEASSYFKSMELKYGIVPDINHYTCIVDGLCRAGNLREAYETIRAMPIEPDDCIWGALLNGCRIQGNNIELAEIAAEHLDVLDPNHSGYRVLLSNIYADGSRWNEKVRVRGSMKEDGVNKSPGSSWIELGTGTRSFFSSRDGDKSDVLLTVDSLAKQLRDEGYVPSTNS